MHVDICPLPLHASNANRDQKKRGGVALADSRDRVRLGPFHGGPDSVAFIYPTYIDHHALKLGVERYRSRTLRPNTLKRAFGRPCGRSHRPSTGTAAASSSNRARTEQHAPFYRCSIASTRCRSHSILNTRTHGMYSERARPCCGLITPPRHLCSPMVDIASTTARRQVHGCLGADKRAGRLTKHGIDMDGGDEAAEAVAEEVAAHSTRAPLSTETQRQLTE